MDAFTFTHSGSTYSLEISFDYSPGSPGVHTLSNGDPGFPDDPEEFDITEVSFVKSNGSKIEIPSEFLDDMELLPRIENLCRNHLEKLASEFEGEAPDDQPDDSGPF
jgi:hypothetical protein